MLLLPQGEYQLLDVHNKTIAGPRGTKVAPRGRSDSRSGCVFKSRQVTAFQSLTNPTAAVQSPSVQFSHMKLTEWNIFVSNTDQLREQRNAGCGF